MKKAIENFSENEIVIYSTKEKKEFARIIKKFEIDTSNFYKSEKYILEDLETNESIKVEIKNDFFEDEIRIDKIYLEPKHFLSNQIKNQINYLKSFVKENNFEIHFKNIENGYISNDGSIKNSFVFNEYGKPPKKIIYLHQLFEIFEEFEINYSENEILYY